MRPYAGLPMAAGWAIFTLAAWIWCARHDYFEIALGFLIAAFVGTFAILIWMSGLFAENADVSSFSDASATCYRRAEDVRVCSIVVAELELGNVQGHVLGANFVERTDHAALHQRPETLNRDAASIRIDHDEIASAILLHGLPALPADAK